MTSPVTSLSLLQQAQDRQEAGWKTLVAVYTPLLHAWLASAGLQPTAMISASAASKGKPKAEWTRLWHLLDRLAALPGDFRIRLSSLEAAEARDHLIEAMAKHPRICPHLHLCLQSGSDRILEGMKRRYRSGGFLERCRRIAAALDTPAFTTDVIIGFPGETEADFAATLDVIRAVGFCKVYVFSYSPREGTPAALLKERVPPQIVAERRERVHEVEAETTRA